jgi:capsular exopolysaccharide synthesis family protein
MGDNLVPAPAGVQVTLPSAPAAAAPPLRSTWPDGTEAASELHLRDVGRFLLRNRLAIAAAAVLGLAAGAAVVERTVPVYESTASLRADEAQPQLALAVPGLSALGGVGTLPTDIETLRSRTLAAALVDSFGLQVHLVRPARAARAQVLASVSASPDAAGRYRLRPDARGGWSVLDAESGRTLGSAARGAPVRLGGATVTLARAAAGEMELQVLPRDEAVDRLRDALQVRRRRGDVNVVDVRYRGTDRALVRDVPNALTAAFMADRLAAQRAQAHGTAEFLRGQIARVAVQLDSAEDALRRFREGERVVSPEQQAGAAVQNAASLRAQRDALRAESDALAGLLAAGGGYRDLVAFPSLLRNQAVSGLLTSLAGVEDRRTELLQRRNPSDPEVQLLSARAREIEAQLGGMARAYQRGLAGQANALDAALTQAEGQMRTLPAREVRLARLQREAGVLEEIYTQMQARLQEAEIGEAAGDPGVRLLDPAVLPREPVAPRPAAWLALALALGLVAGVGGAAVREYADRSVHSRHDITRATGLPVLALVPRAKNEKRPRPPRRSRVAAAAATAARGRPRLLVTEARTPMAEAYARLQVNLAFVRPRHPVRVVTVTSPAPGEGKTTSAVNLAATLARRGHRVVLLDADLRCGTIAGTLGVPQHPGLSELLTGQATLEEVLHTVRWDAGTELHVLPGGRTPPDPARLLGLEEMRQLLQHLRAGFEAVVIDAPPVNLVTDAALLGIASDGVVMVVRSGVTSIDTLRDAVQHLEAAGAPVLGAVLNGVDVRRERGYYGAYGGYAYYG